MTRSTTFGFATAALLVAASAQATTIAHWDFETDVVAGVPVDNQPLTHSTWDAATNPYSWEAVIPDISGNGNDLSVFTASNQFGGMQFETGNPALGGGFGVGRAQVPASDPPAFQCCPGLFTNGDLKSGGNNVGSLAQWTIETTVKFTDVGGWQTMVGMDGIGSGFQLANDENGDYVGGADGNQANLYFQKAGDNTNRFRLNFIDADGYAHIVFSETAAVVNEWYHVAATSDGSTLKIFVNGVEENALDMTASGSFDTSLVAIDESGSEGGGGVVPHAWSVARGMYNNGHGDRVLGVMDDTRISDVALTPDQFLIDFSAGLVGDTDSDGDIDDFDLIAAITNYTGSLAAGTGGKTIADGDTDSDQDVDDFDLITMITGYTGSLSAPAVPEPASLAVLSLGGLALLRRRRA